MSWIDSHCHCTNEIWRGRERELFDELMRDGCEALIQGGIDPDDWHAQTMLPTQPLKILRVFGLHPWTVIERSSEQLERDFATLRSCMLAAEGVGEIGLDFFRGTEPALRKKQSHWFERQLQLANSLGKPSVLHVVRSYPDAWHVIKKVLPKARGLLHSFWAPLEQARSYLDAGWILSVHPRLLKGDPHGILEKFPREQLVFESDAPFPQPDGGHTTPALTKIILQLVAKRWHLDPDALMRQQKQNLSQLFPSLLQGESA